jgi:hypothetical protein
MRAHEFVVEAHGKIGNRRQMPTRGLNTFWDGSRTDSDYTLNRVMMAVACADGSDNPIEINDMSWIGRDRSAHPYTDEEQKMMKQAYKAVGAVWKDLNNGDMNSQEVDSTNTTSPVKSFKGYPR